MRTQRWYVPCALCLALVAWAPLHAATMEQGLAALVRGTDGMSAAKLRHAVRIFQALAQGEDRSCETHYYLARAFAGLGAYYESTRAPERARASLEEGIVAAEVAVRCDRKNAAYQTVLGDVHGMLAGHSGLVGQIRHGQRSATAYARAIELDPADARARVGVGITKLETPELFGGSADEALRSFRLAQELDPTCVDAWIWEGIALRRQEAIPEARAALVHALELAPHDWQARRELDELNEDFE